MRIKTFLGLIVHPFSFRRSCFVARLATPPLLLIITLFLCSISTSWAAKYDLDCIRFCSALQPQQYTLPIPLNQMDDELLFLSAESVRDTRISMGQRLLNYHWLHENANNRIHGGRIFSRWLQRGLSDYRARTKANGSDTETWHLLEQGGVATWAGEYRIRLSDDDLRLVFRYRF